MEQTFQVGQHQVTVRRSLQEKAYVVNSLHFIAEPDASFYLPIQDGTFIQEAEECLLWLNQHYSELKQKAFTQIGKQAQAGNFWGQKLAEVPQLDLVSVRVTEAKKLCWELTFNDSEHDAYTLWVVSFEGPALQEVKRQAW